MKVIFLIVILLGGLILLWLLIPTLSVGPSDTLKARAKNDVVYLRIAMRAYLTEYGEAQRGGNSRLMQILLGDNPKGIVFIDPNKKQISEEGRFIDPWGSPYVFGFSTRSVPFAYSPGKNKIDEGGNGDDIKSWE